MTSEERNDVAPPARFGPFHRLESPTRTPEDARKQEESGEMWGRAPRWGALLKVKACVAPAPEGARGVEFYTDVAPDIQGPNASWRAPQSAVRVEDDYAEIQCVV